MAKYFRKKVAGGTFFFTVVTDSRRPIFGSPQTREMLRDAILHIRQQHAFSQEAFVLLPDHLHTIWTLPDDDDDYSTRWARIKEHFTRAYLRADGVESPLSSSRIAHRERGVWQRRFWEHTIRDEDDFERCFNYIHWNPVKHGYVKRVKDYEWSSFHRYVRLGAYDSHWGEAEAPDVPGAEWE